jgi:uncharacterized protein (TIGR02246 family)
MRNRFFWLVLLCAAGGSIALLEYSTPAVAAQPKGANAADQDAIAKRAEAFIEAFQKGDAKVIAAFWTSDGDYTDMTGKRLAGRDAIEKSFTEFFADNKGLKLRIDSDSLRFVTPDVAIEDGTTHVLHPDGAPPSRAKYTIVHVKKDGQWQLGSVRETVFTAPSNYEHLHGLEGLIGTWADDAGKGEVVRISFNWSENQNFITSTFESTFKNISIGGGTQWIGWDPAAKTVRSWSFFSNGGFGEGAWTQAGKSWTIKTAAVLPDGKKATGTDTVTIVDAETISFQAKDRTVDGKPVPDIKEVRLKRVK